MEFKSNVNKLHYLLSEIFEDVTLEEKSSKELGNYIQISVKENLECKIIITKKELENNYLNWKYDSNPLNENSYWVDRESTIEELPKLIKDIFEKRRFNFEYLKKV